MTVMMIPGRAIVFTLLRIRFRRKKGIRAAQAKRMNALMLPKVLIPMTPSGSENSKYLKMNAVRKLTATLKR